MATMVKEKRREKKKTKEKSNEKMGVAEEIAFNVPETITESTGILISNIQQEARAESAEKIESDVFIEHTSLTEDKNTAKPSSGAGCENNQRITSMPQILEIQSPTACQSNTESSSSISYLDLIRKDQTVASSSVDNVTEDYVYLNERLKRLAIPDSTDTIPRSRECELSHSDAYLKTSNQIIPQSDVYEQPVEDVAPSAPMFEEDSRPQLQYKKEEVIKEVKSKLQCLSLEEAVNLFGGAEMSAVKVMSEREEAIVEAGPVSGPEHPLVDLLSTFRSSLRAVEIERSKLASGYADEERSRTTLWKIEKRNIYQKKECRCGTTIELRAVYEHAELLKERLPVARMRLESLLRDVQDSYCHHQHAALLAYCQIEEFISETTQSNKSEIREALSLILQALRVSDGAAAAVLSAALRRWAAALAASLVDERDVRQLLFVLHHLFRQSRSVSWAARVLQTRVTDSVSAARTLAVLDTLLASPRLDTAVECIEAEAEEADADEAWEEVSAQGGGGAVSEGALREIDLLALLNVFPLRDLVSRIVMFSHADIRQARPYEWGDASGGRGVLRSCCGVRALLATLHRAARAHPHYARLSDKLRRVAAAALEALSCLHRCPRAPYQEDLAVIIAAELQACFTEGFALFGTSDLHKLTTTLLAEEAAKDYCLTFISGLHDKSPKRIESLSIEAPVLPCDVRVRIVTYAAIHREEDHELARIVLDILFQTGGKMKSTSCKAGCVAAARECLPRLIAAHPYLYNVALHVVANMAQVESLDPSVVSLLNIQEWRPQRDEMQAVLQDWAQRCPQLLQQLLLLLDYTPHTGLSLEVQLLLGSWLCSRARSHPAAAESCWRVLMRTRMHRVWWSSFADASTPDPVPEPTDAISSAYAVLATSWGHCIPLICSSGVSALCALASRPREAVHCLAPVMMIMAHSPESVSLTPKFSELFTALLNCGPSLVQRALGRGGASGAELVLRLALTQLEGEPCGSASRASILSAWLHALWRGAQPAGAAALDAAALAAREWPALDAHAASMLQEENAKEHVTNAVRNASTAPLLCECLLRAYHTHREVNTGMFGAVSSILWDQRINNQRIHVDNALQKIKADVSSEELTIYRSAAAACTAPLHHPSHLTLWRLFFHMYLQRPPTNMRDTGMPVGPLYFSGLVKSRTLNQIKKRLQEAATYHHDEAETYKINNSRESSQPSTSRVVKSESITIEKGLLPILTIKDLTGESSESDSDPEGLSESEEDSKVEDRQEDASEVEKKHAFNMACYHTGAERMIRDFCQWLEEGDRVRASPSHADIARFIPEQALEEAWKDTLSRCRPPPAPELEYPRPAAPPPAPHDTEKTPLDVAVKCIMRIKERSGMRSRRLIRSPLEDVDFKDTRSLLSVVDKHLNDIDLLTKEWCTEVSRISSLDGKLWELVASLRVPRPLPPVTKRCTNASTNKQCKPILFHIDEREWCISTGAERGITENRSSARSAVRRLARARPHAARTSAALHSIARRIRDSGAALCVLERAWRGAAHSAHCSAAHTALAALVDEIAQRWVCHDGRLVSSLLSQWCTQHSTALQQALCGALISPRRMSVREWPEVYTVLLRARLPPHTAFSYLSKFEMSHWSQCCDPGQRRELLGALVAAHSRHGPAPAPEHTILLELVGVHTTALVDCHELCPVVGEFARAAVQGRLPPQQWTHVVKAAELVGTGVTFDQLGHVLRELGALWWEARCNKATLAPHATHVAKLLRQLLRHFVAAAVKLSYEPERVGRYAWSALQESWGAWVAPHPATPPLLPSLATEDGQYAAMLQCFVECLQEIMVDCPGSEVALLQQAFEWCTVTHMATQAANGLQEARVQASDLLARLARLPWDRHQWLYGTCLQLATQICATTDREIMSWCCDTWRGVAADTLLRDVADDTLAARLAALLYVFTATHARHHQRVLEEASRLPWWRLPEAALGEALDRFFAVHHNPMQAYHDLPQFQVLLFASELCIHRTTGRAGAHSREKRARALSAWVRAAAAPALLAHVTASTQHLLCTIDELAPYIESTEGEIEELLGRATVIMCMEPAAAAALPVWQQWVGSTSRRLRAASVSAACALTAAPYCAALADAAVKAHMEHNDSSWSELVHRWSASSPWREPHVFLSRACLHAAYVCARAHTHAGEARAALAALHTTTLNFIENEAIIAVWICYACRVARSCATSATSATSEAEECAHAARALLGAWAQPARRSLLRVVTLQADPERTTAHHRILCRLAECILCPSADAAQAYEAACAAARTHADVTHWGRSPNPKHLPRLAVRLYPKYERYFRSELDAAPET